MSQFQSPFGLQQTNNLEYAGPDADTLVISRFFNAVYAWMAVGLSVTAVVAWLTAGSATAMQTIFHGPTLIILFIAEIALVFIVANAINKISASAATALFLVYAALNGLTLAAIFLVYTHGSIFSAFITAAAMFGVMSVYGFVTKTDLTSIGKLAFMALIGIIIASVVNYFVHSSMMTTVIAYIGVLVFVGLTAYDTQKLKYMARQTQGNAALAARMSIVGSLVLYLDFINLFIMLLQIMGDRRR